MYRYRFYDWTPNGWHLSPQRDEVPDHKICKHEFVKLFAEFEVVLHNLCAILEIAVKIEIQFGGHNYHEALLQACFRENTPLSDIFGDCWTQNILWAWKAWRNAWVWNNDHRESLNDLEEILRLKLIEQVPYLIQRLREAEQVTGNAALAKYAAGTRAAEKKEVQDVAKASVNSIRMNTSDEKAALPSSITKTVDSSLQNQPKMQQVNAMNIATSYASTDPQAPTTRLPSNRSVTHSPLCNPKPQRNNISIR